MSSVQDNIETRLELKLTSTDLQLIERAAVTAGCSVNEFAVSWHRVAALQELESRHHTDLSVEDTIEILEAMENPPPPTEELRQAFRDYREFFGDRAP